MYCHTDCPKMSPMSSSLAVVYPQIQCHVNGGAMTTTTLAGLKERYAAYIEEMWERKDQSRATDGFAEDIVDHSAPPGQGPGLAGLLEIFRMMHAAFPDWNVRIELQIEEGDLLVSRIATSGTHTGTFFGIPATGRTFQSTSTQIL